jgi:glycosyltransferase involved in cell wall biosynthesis
MKIAFVYDRVNKFGGAERVLLALHKVWPDAPLYTAVYDKKRTAWADVFKVRPSFLQHIPLARRHHELFPWLTPMAFESFSFDEFDVVLSVTSAEAKSIITKPGTVHICYCLTPTRYLWSGHQTYMEQTDSVSARMLHAWAPTLKRWDLIGSARPDQYVTISKRVEDRIKTYYHRRVERVIYPPVDTNLFVPSTKKAENYFLLVSRFVQYKRIDLVIDAFNELGWPLVIIGSGWGKRMLQNMAKKNITFITRHLTDAELVAYYQKSRAFVFAGDEDFGLIALEAQACGKPVICYRESGMAEIVIDGKTGILFNEQTKASLINALQKFTKAWYDSGFCRHNAERFSTKHFEEEIKRTVEDLVK